MTKPTPARALRRASLLLALLVLASCWNDFWSSTKLTANPCPNGQHYYACACKAEGGEFGACLTEPSFRCNADVSYAQSDEWLAQQAEFGAYTVNCKCTEQEEGHDPFEGEGTFTPQTWDGQQYPQCSLMNTGGGSCILGQTGDVCTEAAACCSGICSAGACADSAASCGGGASGAPCSSNADCASCLCAQQPQGTLCY